MAHGVARSTLSGTVRHLLIVGEALQDGYDLTPRFPIPLLRSALVTVDVPVGALAGRPR